jgi:hypothetical protein
MIVCEVIALTAIIYTFNRVIKGNKQPFALQLIILLFIARLADISMSLDTYLRHKGALDIGQFSQWEAISE